MHTNYYRRCLITIVGSTRRFYDFLSHSRKVPEEHRLLLIGNLFFLLGTFTHDWGNKFFVVLAAEEC